MAFDRQRFQHLAVERILNDLAHAAIGTVGLAAICIADPDIAVDQRQRVWL